MIITLVIAAALQNPSTNEGYYAGLSVLYPYGQVFSERADGSGQGFGTVGSLYNLPKSAPLPPTEDYCVWASHGDPRLANDAWYQWKPRITPQDQIQFVGPKVCFLEDRGKPKNINDLVWKK